MISDLINDINNFMFSNLPYVSYRKIRVNNKIYRKIYYGNFNEISIMKYKILKKFSKHLTTSHN